MVSGLNWALEKLGKDSLCDWKNLRTYTAPDTVAALSPAVLERTAATLLPLLRNVANALTHDSLLFDRSVYQKPRYTLRDAMNNKNISDTLVAALARGHDVTHIPADATEAFLCMLKDMSVTLQTSITKSKLEHPSTAPEEVYPDGKFQQVAPLMYYIVLGIDSYSDANPNRAR